MKSCAASLTSPHGGDVEGTGDLVGAGLDVLNGGGNAVHLQGLDALVQGAHAET